MALGCWPSLVSRAFRVGRRCPRNSFKEGFGYGTANHFQASAGKGKNLELMRKLGPWLQTSAQKQGIQLSRSAMLNSWPLPGPPGTHGVKGETTPHIWGYPALHHHLPPTVYQLTHSLSIHNPVIHLPIQPASHHPPLQMGPRPRISGN